ncbi:MAG TPA: Crp/Fnr family transcriptional regulator [Cyanobacteria bacterium UBA8553]|nr:Crp/Fnr family transcriptional regulator [Cyanobacteria bacterium UBA8553]HAJ62439.1 Crp/Fnr family transcriptional regulator [Cyanobacteria bacterium UBA8543]
MFVFKSSHNPIGNNLLASLPKEEYKRLLPQLETISLSLKQPLYRLNEPIKYVYFPNSGVVSLVNILGDGRIVEVATVGNEGMIGIPILLGVDRIPAETFVQVPGDGLRMKVDVFRSEVPPGSPLHSLLLRYTQALMNHFMQSVVCNQMHSVEERCCRWLLLTHDRVDSDEFPLTQEFLAQMLGVRRATVSVVAATLQKAGLIRYHRGKISVLDRQGLEAGSCECYQVVKQEYIRLLG